MYRHSLFLRAPRKLKKLFTVLLCYLLMLATITPVASAGGGWEAIGRGQVSIGLLYWASASLNRSVTVGTVTLGRFLLLELALVWTAPGALSSSHLSLFQGRATNRARAPEGTFPVLGEVLQEQLPIYTPIAIPSTLRSRRNPLQPRNGKRVGDPGTTLGALSAVGGANVLKPSNRREGELRRTKVGGAAMPRRGSATRLDEDRIPRNARARTVKSHHNYSPAPIGDDAYIQTFFSWALVRTPYANETTYWNDILRSAYANGQSSMIMAARELGKTLFESAEYAARDGGHRLDLDSAHTQAYVTDLYQTYLLRAPDSGGLAYWSSQVPVIGHEAVRRAFDESGEFVTRVSTVTPNGSVTSVVSSLLSARANPRNQPGNGLLTRDATWNLMLVSLPGRAGLDLGLGLSYSSAAVWTRSGPYLYFDEDLGWPSPGFRLGFPTIPERYWDAQVGKNAFVIITSSGSRVELRQIGATTTYEAGDSSYMQLTDNSGSSPAHLLVRTADGIQMKYGKYNNEWRCTEVKDRNGNFITVNYDWLGHITTIVDTLNRTISFHYDGNSNLIGIRQTWNGQTHEWVAFGWGTTTIQPGFTGMVGIANGAQIPVLNLVWLDDGSYYKFTYPTASPFTGQVTRVTRYAHDSHPSVDNHPLTYTAFDYGAQDDSLRLTATRVWAENWTGINGVPNEVQTSYGVEGSGFTVTVPDGTIYKEFYGTGWQRGLVTLSEVWSGGEKKKWTTTTWTQDNLSVGYETNPRLTETYVHDGTNQRGATIGYHTFALPSGASCSLPSDIYERTLNSIYRRSHTEYNLSVDYVSATRRIIGLPAAEYLCDGSQGQVPCTDTSGASLKAKQAFFYDEAGSVQQQGSPVQHDGTNFGPGFVQGRGNLSSARRHNGENLSQYTSTSVKYNTAGSVILTTDAAGHQSNISYTDSFSDSVNRSTFAYPTTVTDADNFSTSVQYHYDLGKTTSTQGPPPAGQPQGMIQTITYDWAGRVERVTTVNTGAYQRFWYGSTSVTSFTTVNNVTDEFYLNRIFDGVGRPIGVASNHPGSTGGYKAEVTVYDTMGRTIKQSNPTEIDGWWVPAGEDAGPWKETQQTYDWQGRPLRTTHPDQKYREASYDNCGCAGGITTLTDEGTIDAGIVKRRQQKIFSDTWGRTWKTEVLNWQGGSVYSATVTTYNIRDQITQVREYAGPEGSGTYQDTTMTYDGYGRLKTRHVPEQSAGTVTTWDYNGDDTIQKITDGRGASQTFGYNSRHLRTSITYAAPGGITVPAPVTFAYDDAGNRTSMTDGTGSVTYQYNQLSQLTSEARQFSGLSGSYPITYDYNLLGQLKKITDPITTSNARIDYGYDVVGQLISITGVNYPASNYVSNIKYRAWGSVKELFYGNGRTASYTYNSRMQPSHFEVSPVGVWGTAISQDYQYYDDGRIKYSRDLLDGRFDRAYEFDHAARIKKALSGAEARGEPPTTDRPYKETFSYDALNHLTARSTLSWSRTLGFGFSKTYMNNRGSGWVYDADGNTTDVGVRQYSYDAAGRANFISGGNMNQFFDGDGQRVKTTEPNVVTYYVRSSVLGGQVIAELDSAGNKQLGFIYLGSNLLSTGLSLRHEDPSGTKLRTTHALYGNMAGEEERDPMGTDAYAWDPYLEDPGYLGRGEGGPVYPGLGN